MLSALCLVMVWLSLYSGFTVLRIDQKAHTIILVACRTSQCLFLINNLSSDFLLAMREMYPNPRVGAVQKSLKFASGFYGNPNTKQKKPLKSVRSLQVVCMNFFDIVLDFILMDAFEDLESPPSSVVAVLRNRWLSDSFKETVNKLHIDTSHSSLMVFTHLMKEWCAFIFSRLWQQLAGLS